MEDDWEEEYEEGEEHFYDDDGTFGVGLPLAAAGSTHGEWTRLD
ncbi:hypothetical protein [Nocardiopsis halotolerans]|nr:hypothetical protein [Nocardiopsis halotolerans]